MSYSWIYYGRKVRRVALFSIKLIDFFLLYLAIGKTNLSIVWAVYSVHFVLGGRFRSGID